MVIYSMFLDWVVQVVMQLLESNNRQIDLMLQLIRLILSTHALCKTAPSDV